MPKTVSSLTALARPLVAQFNSFCEKNGLIGLVQADLICIKCSDSEIYEARRKDAEGRSQFIYQTMVSGRRISLIKLRDAIPTAVGTIEYLELCDQKPDNSQDDRISHIEIVPISVSYNELLDTLKEKGIELKESIRPHHSTHDIKLPSGFSIRIYPEFLIDKIKRTEFV
jgi:predicted metalloenzyme YecM